MSVAKKILVVFFLFVSLPLHAEWKVLQEGFEVRSIPGKEIFFFRIHPQKYRLKLLMASDYQAKILTALSFRKKSGALFVINGGFFDELQRSLGLLQRDGQVLRPLRQNSWGVFQLGGLDGRVPSILARQAWVPESSTMALQVGPRLVIDGKIPSFKEGYPTRRSAVGITTDGLIEIAVSEDPLYLKEWAELMRVDCPQALNLDGGSSTQISVNIRGLSKYIEGIGGVPNALGVFEAR